MATLERSESEIIANATFEALLHAMARPGEIHKLAAPGVSSIILSLLDRECTAFASDMALHGDIRATGAELVPVDKAQFVFCDVDEVAQIIPRLNEGSDYYPDDGATLIVTASSKGDQTITLSGPGIKGSIQITDFEIGGQAWQQRADYIRYPMGFDMVIVHGNDVAALPRSTEIEVN